MASSIRFLTWNVQLRSFGMEALDRMTLEVEYAAQTMARAKEIVQRLRSRVEDYDVICLNEVFDEDARATLRDGLIDLYPYCVAKADAAAGIAPTAAALLMGVGTIDYLADGNLAAGLPLPLVVSRPEDSGLMLFSRLPFDLDDVPFTAWPVGTGLPATYFGWYAHSASDDQWAAKGALGVRLITPWGDPIVVVATHLQADKHDDAEHRDIRTQQIPVLQALVETCRANAQNPVPDRHDVIVMGDFNIEGMLRDYSKLPDEWVTHFQRPGGTLDGALWDAWVWEQAPGEAPKPSLFPALRPRDLGVSVESNQTPAERRYDYCLLRPDTLPRLRQVQHLYIDRALCALTEQVNYLSDHRPLGIDLHLPDTGAMSAPQAHPVVLVPVLIGDTPSRFEASDQFLREGVVHWYRLDENGTYDFSVHSPGQGVQMALYSKDDLSSPMAPYRRAISPEAPDKFALPDAPVFIKVHHLDRNASSNYSLRIRKYTGTSFDDAIVLYRRQWQAGQHKVAAPTSTPTSTLGDGAALTDSLFYVFDTLPVTSGQQQTVTLTFDTVPGSAPMMVILGKRVGDVLSVLGNSPVGVPHHEMAVALDAGEHFVLVQRDAASGFAPAAFSLRWETNVTTVLPKAPSGVPRPGELNPLAAYGPGVADLKCVDDTTGWGADDIAFVLRADGKEVVGRTFLGGMNSGQARAILPWLTEPVSYVDELVLTIIEEDIDEDDIGVIRLPILPKLVDAGASDTVLSNGGHDVRMSVDFAGGRYEFHVMLV